MFLLQKIRVAEIRVVGESSTYRGKTLIGKIFLLLVAEIRVMEET
jgi:hypothetical protein